MISFNVHININLVDNLEYGWTKPTSLIVLVPGVSLLVQKKQVSFIVDHLQKSYRRVDQTRDFYNSCEYKKLKTISQWHFYGSLIQTAAFLALSINQPLFVLPAAVSIYEMQTSAKGNTHEFTKFGEV